MLFCTLSKVTPYDLAAEAATTLRNLTGIPSFDVALVMGSGWVPAADVIGETVAELAVTKLPGFSPPAVAGHAGTVRAVRTGSGLNALIFLGRTHLYEGRGVEPVVHGVRTAVAAGVRTVVLTNAAGGLRPETQKVGDPVLISDHINLTGDNPITGATFIDLTEVYSKRLRDLARAVDPSLAEGVYVAFRGPTYETPAEIRMLRTLGGDLVGMSTVLEAVAAREAGAEVLGISLVTNPGAGLVGEPLNHEEVLQVGRATAARMGVLLAQVVDKL
ncbi:purine-nucleoside phosphorylase [Microbispora bryophytorum]|uniref:Purine nucleoside phosphorylase n=2 Tax=Microbispora bryophytorum TaxID=1460882 RepID=A0A8H9GWH0_9ACTN|nr:MULTISPECIES: purine-nucleoside phosphorylase [Microbispora]MBD3136077.1 purine-nucleoside phosphorylase [Microbispora bryophytorum]MBD3144020.1 purine-nucleoside phosphorylase [Microbispora camponoti]TQS07829.1 purine-nucleoside phosphorylase [Microbispora bryophytorum]GGO04298.1 purine-nucleoside phosphorylase [Microbispora bryophytorum]